VLERPALSKHHSQEGIVMNELLMTPFSAAATAADVLTGVDLSGRNYIVTGGASGIGAETVRALAGSGAKVTIATRNPASADALLTALARHAGAGEVRAAPLDLANLGSVAAFVRAWGEGPLDGLVANAGIMAVPERTVTSDGWELQLATNYLGHFALAVGLHPHLRAAGAGRVVTVSSTAHLRSAFDFKDPQYDRREYDRWSAYAQSKTADVLLAVGIARRWSDDGISANSLMPGWITTKLQRHLDDATLRALGAMDEHGNRIEGAHYKTPQQGAATSVLLAAHPALEGVSGRYFEDNQEAVTVADGAGRSSGVAQHALDPEAAERLWDLGSGALL
jgi:NAD(P)-dependent dehydrogenase (short-subunit alcohol dehydrogenase family)